MQSVISLGAGVQSSAMALMAEEGLITPKPIAAIFADTGAEPKTIYRWLDWLERQLSFPVYRVMKGKGLAASIDSAIAGGRFVSPPFFVRSTSEQGRGQLRRQCTKEFKIEPIVHKLREVIGYPPRKHIPHSSVSLWVGISTDEAARMKPNREKWIVSRWPLIEQGISRGDCLDWMQRKGYPTPSKSSCTFCPYHDNAFWKRMKERDKESWEDAIKMDEKIRGGVGFVDKQMFVHRSLIPLKEVVFIGEPERQLDMFDDECEGMCGV